MGTGDLRILLPVYAQTLAHTRLYYIGIYGYLRMLTCLMRVYGLIFFFLKLTLVLYIFFEKFSIVKDGF